MDPPFEARMFVELIFFWHNSLTLFQLSPSALPWRRHRKRNSKHVILFLCGMTEEELVIRVLSPPQHYSFFSFIIVKPFGTDPACLLNDVEYWRWWWSYLVSWLNPILPWMSDRLASRSRIVSPCSVPLLGSLLLEWRQFFLIDPSLQAHLF
jgi:hypothetical protein